MHKSILTCTSRKLLHSSININFKNSKETAGIVVVPVRHFRKPKWNPKLAESKVSRNEESNELQVSSNATGEVEEINKTSDRNVMRLYRKSLWNWQRQIVDSDLSKDMNDSEVQLQLRRIIEDNEHSNIIRVKCSRDAELVAEWTETSQEIKRMKDLQETDEDLRLEAVKKQVLIEMERLKTSMNLEDLDEAIEQAMSSEVDYNHAIDKQQHLQDRKSTRNIVISSSSSSSYLK